MNRARLLAAACAQSEGGETTRVGEAPVLRVQANRCTPTGVATRAHRQVVNVRRSVIQGQVVGNNGTAAPEHQQAEQSFRSRLCKRFQRTRPTRAALHAPTSAAIIPEGQGVRKRL